MLSLCLCFFMTVYGVYCPPSLGENAAEEIFKAKLNKKFLSEPRLYAVSVKKEKLSEYQYMYFFHEHYLKHIVKFLGIQDFISFSSTCYTIRQNFYTPPKIQKNLENFVVSLTKTPKSLEAFLSNIEVKIKKNPEAYRSPSFTGNVIQCSVKAFKEFENFDLLLLEIDWEKWRYAASLHKILKFLKCPAPASDIEQIITLMKEEYNASPYDRGMAFYQENLFPFLIEPFVEEGKNEKETSDFFTAINLKNLQSKADESSSSGSIQSIAKTSFTPYKVEQKLSSSSNAIFYPFEANHESFLDSDLDKLSWKEASPQSAKGAVVVNNNFPSSSMASLDFLKDVYLNMLMNQDPQGIVNARHDLVNHPDFIKAKFDDLGDFLALVASLSDEEYMLFLGLKASD